MIGQLVTINVTSFDEPVNPMHHRTREKYGQE
jgi:hypothetical protein